MRVDTLIDHAALVTVAGGKGPLAGADLGALALVENGAVAVAEGRVVAAGPREQVLAVLTADPDAAFDESTARSRLA